MAEVGTNRRRPTFTLRIRRAEISEYRADRPIPRARAASEMLSRRSGSRALGRASMAISSRNASTSSMTAARSRWLTRSGSFPNGLLDDWRSTRCSRSGEGPRLCSSFMATRDSETSGLRRRRAFPGYRPQRRRCRAPYHLARLRCHGYSRPRPARPDSDPIRRSGSSVG